MSQQVIDQLVSWVRNRFFGKYRGTVVDNQDLTSRGRLKVQVPAVTGEQQIWAMPCVPYAGDGVGFYAIPENGTGVWIEFESGDPSYPIWTGFFWASGQLPDESNPAIKILKTEKATIRIDDDQDEIIIENDSGSKITLSSEITIESGGAKHTIGSSGIVSEKGGAKSELSDIAFKVNDGALEVM